MRHEDIPEINNPKIRFPVLEGDKLMKEVLNGGYNVHPVPPPNSEIKERIRKRYERERIKISLNAIPVITRCPQYVQHRAPDGESLVSCHSS